MIWDAIKNLFWCGVFHKPLYYHDGGDYEAPADMDNLTRGDQLVCIHCGARTEVI